jgi:hypothetical protein
MGIRISQTGDFKKIEKFLKRVSNKDYLKILDKYGKIGVQALSSATPIDSGKTSSSWGYEIYGNSIYWTNDNINKGVNIAVILQYGHGTRNGGYVQGRDYINPAIRPIFDSMVEDIWKEVTS